MPVLDERSLDVFSHSAEQTQRLGVRLVCDPKREQQRKNSLHRPLPFPITLPRQYGILQAVEMRDVRVIERGQHLRFATEPREAIGIVATAGSNTLIATS